MRMVNWNVHGTSDVSVRQGIADMRRLCQRHSPIETSHLGEHLEASRVFGKRRVES